MKQNYNNLVRACNYESQERYLIFSNSPKALLGVVI